MFVPPNHTSEQVVEIVQRAVGRVVTRRLEFGYYRVDDLKQQAWVIALELLASGRYDPSRPLENFLVVHLKNRILNLKRDKHRRSDAPCPDCYRMQPHQPSPLCEQQKEWSKRNRTKANLMSKGKGWGLCSRDPGDNGEIERDHKDRSRLPTVEEREFCRLVDENLPAELRSIYLRMRDGVSVPYARQQKVLEAISDIMEAVGWPARDR